MPRERWIRRTSETAASANASAASRFPIISTTPATSASTPEAASGLVTGIERSSMPGFRPAPTMLNASAPAVSQATGRQRGLKSRPVGNRSGTAMPMSVNQAYQNDCAAKPTTPRAGASASST